MSVVMPDVLPAIVHLHLCVVFPLFRACRSEKDLLTKNQVIFFPRLAYPPFVGPFSSALSLES